MRIKLTWIILAGILFLFVSFLLIPRDSQYVQLAIDSGDYDYASTFLAPRLKLKNPPLWVLRDAARVASLRGYPAQAARYLEDLLKRNPDEFHDRLELARLYLDLYEPSKAALELGTLLNDDKLPDQEMLKLAQSYDLLSLPSSALSILHRIANEHPHDMSYWKAILVYDSQTGNETDMARTLRILTKSFPNRIDYLVMRLSLAYRRGRDPEVLRIMDRLKHLHEGVDQTLIPAMRSLFRLNRAADAYLLYEQLSPDLAHDDIVESAAWLFYQKKYYAWALIVFEDLIKRHPEIQKKWETAIWLSDKMGWMSSARNLMVERQRRFPVSRLRYHEGLLDLDQRYGLTGQLQRDLLTWLGESGGPHLTDLRLSWQTAEDQNTPPLALARLRQAFSLFPDKEWIRQDLVELDETLGRYDEAGAVLYAQGLLHHDRRLVRQAFKEYADAGNLQAQIGLDFYLANSDTRPQFQKDQYSLFRLYANTPSHLDLRHLLATLQRFPDLSATMELEVARIMLWRHDFLKAKEAIDRISQVYPENRALLFAASDWFMEEDQIDIALSYDKKLVRLLPGDPQGLALLIRDSQWAGHTQHLLVNTKRLIEADPHNQSALIFLGDHAYFTGKFREAIRYYRKAVEEGGGGYALLYHLGSSYREIKNMRMARKMFELSWKSLRHKEGEGGASFRRLSSQESEMARIVEVSQNYDERPVLTDPETQRRRLLYSIKIQAALGNDRRALEEAKRLLHRYPKDREGLYWSARLLWKRREGTKALHYLDRWLNDHPTSKDFLVFKAEILTGTGRIGQAQKLLWRLHRAYPADHVIWADLMETYRLQGRLDNIASFDSHIFSQGETQAPRVSSGMLTLYNSDQWSIHNQDFAVFYPGGASYSFDAKVETPLTGSANYFAGNTVYLGSGQQAGWGTNDFTYAGVRWSPAPGWQVTGEAGDTRLTNSPGFYVNLSGTLGNFSLNLQGFDNMIWGDFGESIVRDGLQTGYMATLSWAVLPRLTIEAESWLFDYTLDNRTLPFGELHTTVGMLDLVLDTKPQIDLVGGYEDWSMLFSSPQVSSLVPILSRQQFAYAALVYQGEIKNRLNFNIQGGGYVDFFTHLPAYEGGAGVSYRFSRALEVFANGDYFNQSVIYNGASQEAVWGFTVWF